MDAFDWQDRYSIGIERIDHQHQYFLGLIEWLSSRLSASESVDAWQRHIEEVMKYATFHFFSEENWMLDHDYPESEAHRLLHGKLVNDLTLKVSQLELGEIEASVLVDFLLQWFFKHTVEQDTKIGQFHRATMS